MYVYKKIMLNINKWLCKFSTTRESHEAQAWTMRWFSLDLLLDSA